MTGTLTPDICVVGAGAAGLTVAAAAAGFGADVVLIERGVMGGDCLNVGCVPSKALIAAARHRHALFSGQTFGTVDASARLDYAAVSAHIHGTIAAIAPHDSVERFEGLGVTVLKETARFVDSRTIEAGGTRIQARRFVVATGSRPAIPPIDGLDSVPYLTNESVFDLQNLPARLAIVGGGPIGCELGQAFQRLGSDVAIVEAGRVLGREDPALARFVVDRLSADGLAINEQVGLARVETRDDGIRLHLATPQGGTAALSASHLLLATGRTPIYTDLDVAAAGIEVTRDGIAVDHRMRTTNPRVFAIGDVTAGPRFTHVGGHQASLVVRQILFRMPARFDPDRMPRTTYTDPELGQVGLAAPDAKDRLGDKVEVHDVPLTASDRARTDGTTDGLVRLAADKRGRIVGLGAVAPHAGEMIGAASLAMAGGLKVRDLASFVAPYPTYSELLKAVGVAYYKKRLTGKTIRTIVRLLSRFG